MGYSFRVTWVYANVESLNGELLTNDFKLAKKTFELKIQEVVNSNTQIHINFYSQKSKEEDYEIIAAFNRY